MGGGLGDRTEAIEVDYDPARTSYERLLAVFWEDHQPLRPAYKRQYRSAIFSSLGLSPRGARYLERLVAHRAHG